MKLSKLERVILIMMILCLLVGIPLFYHGCKLIGQAVEIIMEEEK